MLRLTCPFEELAPVNRNLETVSEGTSWTKCSLLLAVLDDPNELPELPKSVISKPQEYEHVSLNFISVEGSEVKQKLTSSRNKMKSM